MGKHLSRIAATNAEWSGIPVMYCGGYLSNLTRFGAVKNRSSTLFRRTAAVRILGKLITSFNRKPLTPLRAVIKLSFWPSEPATSGQCPLPSDGRKGFRVPELDRRAKNGLSIWNSRGLIRITVIECDRRTNKPLSALVDRFGDSDHRPDEWFDGFWVVTGVSTTFFGVAPGKLFESFDYRICISTGKGCFLDSKKL